VHLAQCQWAHICRGVPCAYCQPSIDDAGPDDLIGCAKAENVPDWSASCLQGEIEQKIPECPH
jgi:hypothetical protein